MIKLNHVCHFGGMGGYEEEKEVKSRIFHLILVTYGKCVYWVNNEKFILEKGDILLIPSGAQYYGKSIPTVFHSKYGMDFVKTGEDPQLPILESKEAVKLKIGCYDLIYERVKRIKDQWTERPSYYEVMTAALLTEILTYINIEWDRRNLSSGKYRLVEIMRIYIKDHYRSKITKEDLGEAIRRSPNYAASLFSTITGQTIGEYVHMLRVNTAIYMLTESQLTVNEISEFLGYSDVSYFHRIFKRITGKVPSSYLSERHQL
ncbi:helix-turn-helix domain-containing protein [Paenibacillus sp. J2TS4]|uniref:AraC family transcriptional regulator n=1 Tax=Paenibacillus sp. J2TS4 TaxID=2807194 RepID=UPI001B2D6A9E|nr:helix-turn-helix domain-containing protein [Paenibacillus sp. J2TS4]GIP35171.1 AraC family transcriptional regulator [Paenibacillus sp. J2TS4]